MRIACFNPGSSSVKLSVIDGDVTRSEESVGFDGVDTDLARALPDGVQAAAVRVVHGGTDFLEATVVTEVVLDRLRSLSWLAPLHNPVALGLIDRVRELRPGLPIVACFDTAFHSRLREEASTYPVPGEWTRRWGLRRFGFHGLSHGYSSRRAAEMIGQRPHRLVTCHLGAGASLCAIRDGLSVDTTMGFTPMEGLMMATRSGSVDPGVILFALRQGLSVDEVERALDRESGILGVSGISADFRVVVGARDAGDAAAELALSIYRHRLVQGIAAMVATLGGIDALVFTGGVGENADSLREEACSALAFLGIVLSPGQDDAQLEDRRLSPPGSATDVLVVHAREDVEMARHATALLAGPSLA